MAGGHFGCKWLRGDVSAGLPAPPAALLRASLAFPGRPTSQSVTPIAVLHSSLHSIIFIIIHHAASAASRERGIPLHRIFGDQRHKTKKQREKKSLRTSGSLQARSQLTKFFLLYPTGGGSLSEEERALSCFAAPNTQTCLAL